MLQVQRTTNRRTFGRATFFDATGQAIAQKNPLAYRTSVLLDDGRRDNDSIVGLWAQRVGLPLLVANPSLVDHIGVTSALGHVPLEGRGRIAWQFLGEAFDPAQEFPDFPMNGLAPALQSSTVAAP